MKRILLTGSNGYIGRHVAAELTRMGAVVIAVDMTEDEGVLAEQHIAADIFDSTDALLDRLDSVPDACLHMAWRNGFNHMDPSHMEDLSSHYEFLEEIAKSGIKQISVMGSMHEVGYWEGAIDESTPCRPQSLYGIAKNALRESLFLSLDNQQTRLQWIRAFYIYGDDEKSQSIFGKVFRAAKSGEKTFPFTTGTNKYDFLSIGELSNQIARVVMQDEINGIINCCSGTPISLAEAVEGFIERNDLAISLDYGAFPDRPYDSPGVWGDSSKIDRILTQ